ncbi:cysteine proteinase-like isoform X3 [Haliotis rufescens]|uniref:cysteine proteinase-like isoform X3 n=1 Tax=Haliotis rufescens TaxID=6454 RepID=UPI00201F0C75|nr:cysteine proteinase-like isoform X3 [Haliotis rufescens]
MKLCILLSFLPLIYGHGSYGNLKLVGGWENADISKDDVQNMAEFALDTVNAKENSQRQMVTIESATTQVVSGINYKIVLRVTNGGTDELCHMTVYDQSWTRTRTLTDYSCKPTTVLGGVKPASLDKDVQAAVMFAVEYHNSRVNSMYRAVAQSVEHVTEQLVAGTLYTFSVSMVDTTCGNSPANKGKGLEDCAVADKPVTTACSYKVLYQAWKTPNFTLESEKCGQQNDQPAAPVSNQIPKIEELLKPMLAGVKVGDSLPELKDDLASKLKDLLSKHKTPRLEELLGPDKTLPLFGLPNQQNKAQLLTNKVEPLLKRQKKDFIPDNLHPLLEHIGTGLLGAFKHVIGGDLCHGGHFKDFTIKHGKVYDTVEEEVKRFAIFCENMKIARQLNKIEQGTAVYGATKFADLTQKEFKQKYLSKTTWDKIPNHGASTMYRAKIPRGATPKAFDWRDHGAVTPVKNQGQCGSCWAFSTTGNIEGQWQIKNKRLISLSEQELVDCDKLDEGCNGGLPSNAYMSIMKLGGLETEGDYKYDGEDEKCAFNKSEVVVKINGAVNISSNEDDMASWLAQNGPISIGINANAMQFYFGGISHPWSIFCNPKSLDHGVLIVGYGVEGSEPYWIVKNSWGPDWGEKGYYRVYRGGGVCGLNTMCTSAVVN